MAQIFPQNSQETVAVVRIRQLLRAFEPDIRVRLLRFCLRQEELVVTQLNLRRTADTPEQPAD